jgi:hypothetical protein
LYEQHLSTGQGVDVMVTTPIATRTSSDPHALAELSDATIVNRRNAWNKTYQKVTGSTDKAELPYVELGEYRESKGPFIVSTIVKFCMVLS